MEDSIRKNRLVIIAALIVATYVVAALWLKSCGDSPEGPSVNLAPLLKLHNALKLEP